MEKIISKCGLFCHECEAYIATQTNDETQRIKVAREWSKLYNADIKPENIYCDGCLQDGENLFNHCKVCDIRKCAKEKEVKNCAHCSDFICEKLDRFFKIVPECKINLEHERDKL